MAAVCDISVRHAENWFGSGRVVADLLIRNKRYFLRAKVDNMATELRNNPRHLSLFYADGELITSQWAADLLTYERHTVDRKIRDGILSGRMVGYCYFANKGAVLELLNIKKS